MSTTEVKVQTKLNKNEEKGKETILTLDWEGVTEEQMRELATRSAVIRYQSILRTSGTIPAEDTLKVADLFNRAPRVRKQPTAADIVEMAKNNPELAAQLKELLKVK